MKIILALFCAFVLSLLVSLLISKWLFVKEQKRNNKAIKEKLGDK